MRLRQKIAYIDVFCGPGRYRRRQQFYTLLVLERAIAKPALAREP